MPSEFELFARKLDALLFDAEQVVQGSSSPWAPAVLKLSDDTSDLLQSWDKIKYQWPELSAVRVAWVVAGSYAKAAISLLVDVSLQAQHCKNALALGDRLKNHFKQSLVPQDFEAIMIGLRVELKSLTKTVMKTMPKIEAADLWGIVGKNNESRVRTLMRRVKRGLIRCDWSDHNNITIEIPPN
jgi:hypothetical protein